MKKMKWAAVLLVLVVLALSACGAAGGGGAQQAAPADGGDGLSGTVTHWVWGDFEERGAYRFNNYYPNININYVVTPSDEIVARFQTTLAAGGELPDVLNVEIDARAMLYSLDGVFYVLDDDPFNIDRSLLVDFSIPLLTNPQGQILGVQIDNCVGGFLYKRDLALEFFGTDDPGALEAMFQTPADYVYWSAHVNAQSGGNVHMFASAGDAFRAFSSLGAGNAAPVVINNYQLNVRPLFMDTFNIMEGLISNNGIGTFTPWTPGWMAAFSGNDVIFFPGPTWFISHVLKPNDPDGEGNWGLIGPPGGAFSWGGTAYSFPVGAQNVELGWHYIRWLTMSQAGAESFFSAHATPTLYQPAYYTDLYTNNPDPFFAGQDVVARLLEIATHPDTQSRPLSVFDSTVLEAAALVWVEMVDNGMSAADGMDMLEDEMIFIDSRLQR
jgi:multiple sugar transport system substrate-binding protein